MLPILENNYFISLSWCICLTPGAFFCIFQQGACTVVHVLFLCKRLMLSEFIQLVNCKIFFMLLHKNFFSNLVLLSESDIYGIQLCLSLHDCILYCITKMEKENSHMSPPFPKSVVISIQVLIPLFSQQIVCFDINKSRTKEGMKQEQKLNLA